ncbi:hypothetical protein IU451_28935 [Nocardia cyriacigeorgica]|uniref:hypothetical protein n=1 Tax=Nocardia cyriacigeorgica TaxID=135487 RepID=UPI0018936907|nr:hypothetical protein [Nocardia cyriacigeorgica]MBF6326529.1 hypothetical protein [Nocardia cyriacigeorgica]
MSREVRRVPVDFNWSLNKVWDGYITPEHLLETTCPDCEYGFSPYAKHLKDLWYGYTTFDPASAGSARLTVETPQVWARAERNVKDAPWYYGSGHNAIVTEARRLARLWNGQWCHHLTQDDVNALLENGRLKDFTHTWTKGEGWRKLDPPVVPTAAQVNAWSLAGMGHDSINAMIVIEARCEREGQRYACETCDGRGSVEKYPGQRAEAEAWQPTEPPTGDGWQLWETVSEGSPITPVFATRHELVMYLCSPAYERRLTYDQAEGLVDAGWVPSAIGVDGQVIRGEESESALANLNATNTGE